MADRSCEQLCICHLGHRLSSSPWMWQLVKCRPVASKSIYLTRKLLKYRSATMFGFRSLYMHYMLPGGISCLLRGLNMLLMFIDVNIEVKHWNFLIYGKNTVLHALKCDMQMCVCVFSSLFRSHTYDQQLACGYAIS